MPYPVERAGGQAVFGGVMMRVGDRMAVAVRRPDGGIEVRTEPVPAIGGRWRDVPLVRGLVTLAQSLPMGYRALRWSAGASGVDEGRASSPVATLVSAVAVVAAFAAGPGLLVAALGVHGALAFNLLEGTVKLAILLGYLVLIGRVPEVRRLFADHGAEHKAVAAYEAGGPLTPDVAARFTTRHVRCGTSLLLTVAVCSVLVHLLLGRPDLPLLILSRILLVPVVAAIAAELQLRAAVNVDKGWVRALLRPGLALQGLTTREPTLDQLEVAIAALEAALPQPSRSTATVSPPVAQLLSA